MARKWNEFVPYRILMYVVEPSLVGFLKGQLGLVKVVPESAFGLSVLLIDLASCVSVQMSQEASERTRIAAEKSSSAFDDPRE